LVLGLGAVVSGEARLNLRRQRCSGIRGVSTPNMPILLTFASFSGDNDGDNQGLAVEGKSLLPVCITPYFFYKLRNKDKIYIRIL
jgi:hypothetical protein